MGSIGPRLTNGDRDNLRKHRDDNRASPWGNLAGIPRVIRPVKMEKRVYLCHLKKLFGI